MLLRLPENHRMLDVTCSKCGEVYPNKLIGPGSSFHVVIDCEVSCPKCGHMNPFSSTVSAANLKFTKAQFSRNYRDLPGELSVPEIAELAKVYVKNLDRVHALAAAPRLFMDCWVLWAD